MKYIDIHTHKKQLETGTIAIRNVFPENDDGNSDGLISIGLHPWYLETTNEKQALQTIEKAIQRPDFAAIGECGIDRVCDTDFDKQQHVFIRQIELSEHYQKPLIVHCVKAYPEVAGIRKEQKARQPWIIHGFNGNEQIISKLIELNCYLSFGHFLLSTETKAARFFPKIPDNQFFLETDESTYSIMDIYKKATQIKNKPMDDMIQQIEINFENIFHKQ